MYKKNDASPKPIYAKVIDASDGSPITSGVVARHYQADGTQSAADNTPPDHEGSGLWRYSPSQTETNETTFSIEFYHVDAVGTGPVVQVVTNIVDGDDTVRMGMTALPNAVPDHEDGLPTHDKLLAYTQLLARSDEAIETDRATELSAINADEDSGAGDYNNEVDSQEAIRDRGDVAWLTGGSGGATASYTTSNWTRTEGDNDGGAGSDTATVNGTTHDTGETTSGTYLEVVAVFTLGSGETGANIDFWGFYDGGGDHYMTVMAYNDGDSLYEPIGTIGLATAVQHYGFTLSPGHTKAADDTVTIKFLHGGGTGKTAHVFSVDKAAVNAYSPVTSDGSGLTAIPWNASWDTEVQSECDDAMVALGLDHLVSVAVAGTDVVDNSIIAKMVSKSATADWDSYTNTTESLEALRDRGDAAWITAVGFSTHDAAAVVTALGDGGTLTTCATATSVTVSDKTGFSLSSTGADAILKTSTFALAMADAVWDELLAGHTTADTSGLVLNEWQDGGRLDLILDTAAGGSTGTGARTITVTVNDGSDALESARVRFTNGAETYVGSTNSSGVVVFSLDDATWTVAITKPAFTFTPTTLVVSDDDSQTYSMAAAASAGDNYATTAQLYTRYGQTNCEQWADMEGLGSTANAVAIAARITDALTTATARINDRLRLGSVSFNIPLTGTVPTTIMHICRRLAGYQLSTARGVKDYDKEGAPMTRVYVDYLHAMEDLDRVATGTLDPNYDI